MKHRVARILAALGRAPFAAAQFVWNAAMARMDTTVRILALLGRGPFAVLQATWDTMNDWVAAANRRRDARDCAATREGR